MGLNFLILIVFQLEKATAPSAVNGDLGPHHQIVGVESLNRGMFDKPYDAIPTPRMNLRVVRQNDHLKFATKLT